MSEQPSAPVSIRQPTPPAAFGCGLAMGVADAVPGVSGGTIALILGIYEALIDAIGRVLDGLRRPLDRGARAQALRALLFLVPLVAGAGISLLVSVKLLVGAKPELAGLDVAATRAALDTAEGLLIDPATAPLVFAFFFGLVLASVPEPWRHKRATRGVDWPLALLGAIASGGLALSPVAGGDPSAPALLGAGALAISVMLLPGISGSLALLVIGMYQPVAGAVHERDLATLAWFVAGAGLGVILFVPLLRKLLAVAHDRTMAVLSGLMAGSLVALWPWKAHYLPEAMPVLGPMTPLAPYGGWWWCLLAALAGAGVVVAMTRLAARRRRG